MSRSNRKNTRVLHLRRRWQFSDERRRADRLSAQCICGSRAARVPFVVQLGDQVEELLRCPSCKIEYWPEPARKRLNQFNAAARAGGS